MTRALVLIALAFPAAIAAPDTGELFRARCASCHTVPDPLLRTDRAWLAQVDRTA